MFRNVFVLLALVLSLGLGCSKPVKPAETASPTKQAANASVPEARPASQARITPNATSVPKGNPEPPAIQAPTLPKPVIKKVYDQLEAGICNPSENEIDQAPDLEGNYGVVDTKEIENWDPKYAVFFALQSASGELFVDCLQTMAWSHANTTESCPDKRVSLGDFFIRPGVKYRWKVAVSNGNPTPTPLSDWQYSDGFTMQP